MNDFHRCWKWVTIRMRCSAAGLIALMLVVIGLLLGTTVHMGFLSFMALGAFGPGILRQLGFLHDFDEFQKEAAAKSGLRAYLVTGILLMVVVIAENWHGLSLSNDALPASTVVILMLVIYYSSYCLSFWDTRKAVSRVLLAFGLFWLAFALLSHTGNWSSLMVGVLAVPGPFILASILCHRWPRMIGLLLFGASVWAIWFFRIIPRGVTDSQEILKNAFTLFLIPLPLTVAGVALMADSLTNPIESGDRFTSKATSGERDDSLPS